VEELKYWIGRNESGRKEVNDKTSDKRWIRLEVQFEGNRTELYVWVEFTNGTIIKINERIEVYYHESDKKSITKETQTGPVIEIEGLVKFVVVMELLIVVTVKGIKLVRKLE